MTYTIDGYGEHSGGFRAGFTGCAAKMRIIDMYGRAGDKLTENWAPIELQPGAGRVRRRRDRPPDGKLHADDAAVQRALVKWLEMLTTPYKGGYVARAAINRGDSDNNNAFHAQEMVMTPNDTVSILAR